MNNENLTPFKPGVSGNPNGRPKKEYCLTDILKEQGNIEDAVNEVGTKVSRKNAIAEKLWGMATGGDVVAIKYLMDRVDGKPLQQIEATVQEKEIDMSRYTEEELKQLAELNRKARS